MPTFQLPKLPGQQTQTPLDRMREIVGNSAYGGAGRNPFSSLANLKSAGNYVRTGEKPAFNADAFLNALTGAAPSGDPNALRAAAGNSPYLLDKNQWNAVLADPRYRQAMLAYHNSANQVAHRQDERNQPWYRNPVYLGALAVGGAGLAGTLAAGAGAAGAVGGAGAAGAGAATVPGLGAGGAGTLGAIAPFEYGAGAAGAGAAGGLGAAGAAAAGVPWYNTFLGQAGLNTGFNLLSGYLGNRAQKGAENRSRKQIEERIRQALAALSPEHINALAQQFLPQAAANMNAAGQTAIQAVREQAARTGQLESPRALSYEAGTRAKLAGDVQQAAFDRAFNLAGGQASAITGAPYTPIQPRTGIADAITNSVNQAYFAKALQQQQKPPAGVPYAWPGFAGGYGTPLNTPSGWMGGY